MPGFLLDCFLELVWSERDRWEKGEMDLPLCQARHCLDKSRCSGAMHGMVWLSSRPSSWCKYLCRSEIHPSTTVSSGCATGWDQLHHGGQLITVDVQRCRLLPRTEPWTVVVCQALKSSESSSTSPPAEAPGKTTSAPIGKSGYTHY